MSGVKSNDRPLVTLFLTAYNQEETVRAAVEGALSQTYSPLEIILSDDCSTDRTFEIMAGIVAAYQGPHAIRLNRNEKNLGIVGHVNKMFAMGSGVLFVASAGDDVSFSSRVESLVELWLERDMKPDGLCSGYVSVSGNQEDVVPAPRLLDVENHCRLGTSNVLGATAAWSRRLVERWGPLPEDGLVEDRVLTLRALLGGGMVAVDRPLVWSRRGRVFDGTPPSWRAWELWRLQRLKIFLSIYSRDLLRLSELAPSFLSQAEHLQSILFESGRLVERDTRLLSGGRVFRCRYAAVHMVGGTFSSRTKRTRVRRALGIIKNHCLTEDNERLLDPGDHRGIRRCGSSGDGLHWGADFSPTFPLEQSRTDAAFRAVAASYVTRFLRFFLGFVVTPIVLAKIGQELYGFWAIVGSVIGYVGIVDFGITGSVGTLIAREQRSIGSVNKIASNAIVVLSLAGLGALVFSVIASIYAPSLISVAPENQPLVSRLVLLAGIGLAISFPVRTLGAVLRGTQHIATLRLAEFGLALFRTGVLLLLLLYRNVGIMALPWSTIASSIMGLLVFVMIVKRSLPGFKIRFSEISREYVMSILGVSAWWFLGSMGALFIYQTDNIVIGRFLGPAAVAVFTLTFRIPTLAREQLYQLNLALAPGIGDLVGQGKHEQLQELFHSAMRVVLFLGLFSGIMLAKLNGEFVTLWVGPKNYGGDALTFIMAGSLVYLIVFHFSSVILTNHLDLKVLAGTRFVEGILNLILSLILVRNFGIEGVAAGTLLAGLLTSAWFLPIRACRLLGIPVFEWVVQIGTRGALFFIGGMLGFFVVPSFEVPSWGGFVGRGILLFSYLLVLGWYVILPRDEIIRRTTWFRGW